MTVPTRPPQLDALAAGLDLITTAVVVTDRALVIRHANSAALALFGIGDRLIIDLPLNRLLHGNPAFLKAVAEAAETGVGVLEHDLSLDRHLEGLAHINCIATPMHPPALPWSGVVLELRAVDQRLRIDREEKLIERQILNRELLRNLAHEIKNPLGGIRGSAQLLERELPDVELREFTQVIIKESDRLQTLMNRMLAPARLPNVTLVNIHEVLERVRSLIIAEYPDGGLTIRRDYDISLPEFPGDKEQLIQALLNVVRNASEAMHGQGAITLGTRIARQVTIHRERHRLAILINVIDNGPGVPAHLKDRIFFPLVSGRAQGSGLGLSIAQDYIAQHRGVIEFRSEPGNTCFTITLPVRAQVALSRPGGT
jgi:two-component system nitrogen regulation sensor histidine kinase GlnL